MKKLLTTSSNRKLSRSLSIFFPPLQVDQARAKKKKSGHKKELLFRGYIPKINEMLNQSVEKLNRTTDHIFPQLTLSSYFFYSDPQIVSIIEKGGILNRKELRAFACFIEVDEEKDTDVLKQNEISHLVAIQIDNSAKGWKSIQGTSSVKILTSEKYFCNIVHDILLDITMFHSWQYLTQNYADIQKRIDFSREKSIYALERKLESFYGPIQDADIRYFSLASCCRRGDHFDFQKYEEIWRDFLKAKVCNTGVDSVEFKEAHEPAIDQIFQYYRHKGELSKAEIAKKITNLKKGLYVLMLTDIRPSRKILRNNIASIFGKMKWRKFLVRIEDFKTVDQFIRYSPYISFFKFKV